MLFGSQILPLDGSRSQMPSEEDAQRAIRELDGGWSDSNRQPKHGSLLMMSPTLAVGQDLDGRQIRVDVRLYALWTSLELCAHLSRASLFRSLPLATETVPEVVRLSAPGSARLLLAMDPIALKTAT